MDAWHSRELKQRCAERCDAPALRSPVDCWQSHSNQCAEGRFLQRLALLNQNSIVLQNRAQEPAAAFKPAPPDLPETKLSKVLCDKVWHDSHALWQNNPFELPALFVLSAFVVLRWNSMGRAGHAGRPASVCQAIVKPDSASSRRAAAELSRDLRARWSRPYGLWDTNEASMDGRILSLFEKHGVGPSRITRIFIKVHYLSAGDMTYIFSGRNAQATRYEFNLQ